MIAPKVKEIVGRLLKVENVDLNQHLENDLGADSLDKAELMMEMSDAFDIDDISDYEVDRVRTVGDIVKLIERKKEGI